MSAATLTMVRAATRWALPTALAVTVAAVATAGVPGLWGGLIGSAVALAFFGVAAVVMVGTARLGAVATTVLAAGSYLAQVLFLLVVVVALHDAEWLSVAAFAVAVVAVSAAWLLGLSRGHVQVVRSSRLRL